MLGAGDAVIGINPATDNPERAHALLSMLDEIRAKLDIPTQTCVLAHITTTLNLMRRGSPIDLAIAGTEAANRSFGISWQCSERLARRHCRFGGDPSVTMSCISKLAKAAHSRRTPISPKPHSGRLSQRRRCRLWYAERPRSLLPCFETARRRNVRYWHKADMGLCAANVRYWG